MVKTTVSVNVPENVREPVFDYLQKQCKYEYHATLQLLDGFEFVAAFPWHIEFALNLYNLGCGIKIQANGGMLRNSLLNALFGKTIEEAQQRFPDEVFFVEQSDYGGTDRNPPKNTTIRVYLINRQIIALQLGSVFVDADLDWLNGPLL